MDHKELLKVIRNHIRNLEKNLNNSRGENLPFQQPQGLQSIFEPDLYFIKSSYSSSKNSVEYPCYLVTQRGCELLGHKMTGVKGNRFTALYINEFHRLRNEAEAIPAPQEAPQIEQESLFDHEPQAPQTQEERDLEYLKRRLLNDVLESTTVLELGKNIVKTLELITVLDK